jgi:hypothetical protein
MSQQHIPKSAEFQLDSRNRRAAGRRRGLVT